MPISSTVHVYPHTLMNVTRNATSDICRDPFRPTRTQNNLSCFREWSIFFIKQFKVVCERVSKWEDLMLSIPSCSVRIQKSNSLYSISWDVRSSSTLEGGLRCITGPWYIYGNPEGGRLHMFKSLELVVCKFSIALNWRFIYHQLPTSGCWYIQNLK